MIVLDTKHFEDIAGIVLPRSYKRLLVFGYLVMI